jgi:hypothetical protein
MFDVRTMVSPRAALLIALSSSDSLLTSMVLANAGSMDDDEALPLSRAISAKREVDAENPKRRAAPVSTSKRDAAPLSETILPAMLALRADIVNRWYVIAGPLFYIIDKFLLGPTTLPQQ